MPETTIVDIYCRVAVDEPDNFVESSNSLDAQEEACRQYCAENGLTIGMVYQEVFSGIQYRERPMLTKLRMRYRYGETLGVIVTTLNRLSRSQVHLAILMGEMEQYNVTFHTVKEKLDTTLTGKLIREVVALTAEVEREKALEQ